MTNILTKLACLYLIRHGETAWSLSGQHTGRSDLSLTEHGEQESRRLGERLRAVHLRQEHGLGLDGLLKNGAVGVYSHQQRVFPAHFECPTGFKSRGRAEFGATVHPGWRLWIPTARPGDVPSPSRSTGGAVSWAAGHRSTGCIPPVARSCSRSRQDSSSRLPAAARTPIAPDLSLSEPEASPVHHRDAIGPTRP